MIQHRPEPISFMRAAVIQFTSKYLNVGIQLLLTAVLARLLSPREYGVMAGITIFTNLFFVLADMGFGPAIVQYKNLTSDDYGGIFIFSISLGILLTLGFCLLSYPIANFFGDRTYINLCQQASISVLFNTINMVPNGLLLKWRRFDLIGVRLVTTTLLGGAIAIVMALNGFGTAALVWNLNIVAFLILLWNILSVRKKLTFTNVTVLSSVKKVLSFSLYQAGFGIINYFSRNMDHLLIGRFFGSIPLGLYDKAYKLTTYPIQFLPGVLGTILQPYLSDYQNNREKLHQYQMKLVSILALVGAYIMFIFLLCSEDLVNIMYGPRWKDCVPLFAILSISIIFQMVMNITGGILQSAGRTDLLFHQSLWATGIMLALVLIGSLTRNFNILTVCVTLAFILQTYTVAYHTTYKAFGHKISEFFKPVFTNLSIALVIFLPFAIARYVFSLFFSSTILNFLAYGVGYSILFFVVFYLHGDVKQIVQAVLHKYHK